MRVVRASLHRRRLWLHGPHSHFFQRIGLISAESSASVGPFSQGWDEQARMYFDFIHNEPNGFILVMMNADHAHLWVFPCGSFLDDMILTALSCLSSSRSVGFNLLTSRPTIKIMVLKYGLSSSSKFWNPKCDSRRRRTLKYRAAGCPGVVKFINVINHI